MKLPWRKTPPCPEPFLSLLTDGGKFHPDLWWWSFDTFVCGLIAEAAKKLREDGCGYPSVGTEADWHSYLFDIELALREYRKFDADFDLKALAAAKMALHKFVDRLGSWWD